MGQARLWVLAAGGAAGVVTGVVLTQLLSASGWVATAIVGLFVGVGVVAAQAWERSKAGGG